MGNNEYIPKASETETHKVADFTGGAANTIYKQVPEGAVVTKLFYRFNGKDHGFGAPARVPHLAVLDDKGTWHEVYDKQKKGPHNTLAGDFTFARGANQWHNAMRSFTVPVVAGNGNNLRIEFPAQADKNITVKKAKFSVEFRS